MLERLYQLLGALIWRTILGLLVVLAIVVSAAGVLTPMLPSANSAVAEFIEDRTGLQILIGSLDGEMRGFRPRVKLQDVQIIGQLSDDATAVFGASSVELTVNLWRSLIQWQLVVAELSASNIDMPAAVDGVDRSIVIPFDPNVFATEIERIELDAMRVTLSRLSAPKQRPLILDVHIGLQRLGSERRLQVVATDIAQNRLIASGSGLGNPLQFGRFEGQFTGQLQARDLSPITQFLGADIDGEGVANLWVEAASAGIETTISAELSNVALQQSAGEIDRLSLLGAGSFDGLRSVFYLAQLNASEEGRELVIPPMSIEVDAEVIDIRSEALDLEELLRMGRALQPADSEMMTLISTLAPVGVMRQLTVSEQRQSGERSIDFRFDGLGWAPYKTIPGATNLSGSAVIKGNQGNFTLQSSDLSVSIPQQYPKPIVLAALSAEFGLSWSDKTLQLFGGKAVADAESFVATALVSASVPLDGFEQDYPQLFLSMASSQVPVADMRALVPQGIDREVYQWIQRSVNGGMGRDAAFVWRGSLLPKDLRRRSIQLATAFDIDSLEILPILPKASDINGRLVLDNGLVTVIGDAASVGDIGVSDALVQVGRRDGKSILISNASLASEADSALKQLQALEFLDPGFQTVLARTDAAGDLTAALSVQHAIKDRGVQPDVALQVTINNLELIDRPSGIRGNQLRGDFTYHQGRGITTGLVTGNLMGSPASVKFDKPDLGDQVDLTIDARARIEDWRGYVDVPLALEASGETDVQLKLRVSRAIELTASSSLQGIELNLPAPLGKSAQDQSPIAVTFKRAGMVGLSVAWPGRLQADYRSTPEDDSRLWVDLSDRVVAQAPDFSSRSSGERILVSGGYQGVDVQPWLSFFGNQLSNNTNKADVSFRVADLKLENASLGARSLGDVKLDAEIDGSDFTLAVDSDWLQGTAKRSDGPEALQVAVSEINLDFLLAESDPDQASKGLELEALRQLPNTQLTIDNIRWRESDIGGLSLSVGWEQSDLYLSSITGLLAGFNLNDETALRWSLGEGGDEQTQLKFVAALDDPEQFFPLFSAEPVMRLSRGDVDTDLLWPGSPMEIDLQSVSGVANLQFADGSFLPVSSDATGALRFISLFNLAGLVQRSNVNQLFDSGLTFDRANGDIAFNQGLLSVNGFSVRNSGGSLNLVGALDTNRETIDGELSVTLPLVDNIPWVAALAGGLPVAAGAYLASKIFEDQVNRLSSGVYEVTGDIAQPNVRFVRVFDAKASVSSQDSATSESERK